MKKLQIALAILVFLSACAPASTPTALPATATSLPASATPVNTPIPPTATATPIPSPTTAPTATETATTPPTETATPALAATATQTLSEKLQTHIVFYLILPEKGRTDACGNITLEPIISQRMRTGDKIQDVQIALNMLFSVGSQFYGAYYNALWNTQLDIQSYTYEREKDYMTIRFGGYLPISQISDCDKHGIREQIWKTFYHYGFKEKTFMYYDKFFIDQLSR